MCLFTYEHAQNSSSHQIVSSILYYADFLFVHVYNNSHFPEKYTRIFVHGPGGGGTPYNGLYGEAPPERGTFFRLQVYERVGISQVEVYKRVGKSVI